MGLTGDQVTRFGRRVAEVMEDYFGGSLRAGGIDYAGSCSGGEEQREWDGDGLAVTRRVRVVRVSRTLMALPPAAGERVTWTPAGETAWTEVRVDATPARPHESWWTIRCHEV